MKTTTIQAWQQSVSNLAKRLHTDWRNSRILQDPWSRIAHSMVQGWGIRLIRPPAKGNAHIAARPTWKEFARRGTGILASKRLRARKSNWQRWSQNRVTAGSRYIPKGKRQW